MVSGFVLFGVIFVMDYFYGLKVRRGVLLSDSD